MKEFEKEWELLQKINCWGKSGHDKNVGKILWKAALDLVLSTFNKNIELSDLGNTYDIVEVYSMIEKELQE